MGKFAKGQPRAPGAGIKKGQQQGKTLVRKRVFDLVAETGRHPVNELMALVDNMAPKDAARVWLDLLQYLEPKLSAQAITVNDAREEDTQVIDVTPMTTDELLTQAKGDEE